MIKLFGFTVFNEQELEQTKLDSGLKIEEVRAKTFSEQKIVCDEKLVNRNAVITNLQEQNRAKDEDIVELIAKIPPKNELEEAITSKYPKQTVFWSAGYVFNHPETVIKRDVRWFLNPNDAQLPTFEGSSYDEIADKCRQWVIRNIQYVSDNTNFGVIDFWNDPVATVQLRKDDCDGMNMLLATLMLHSGIPYYRVRVNAGVVNSGAPAPEGHLYVSYCRDDSTIAAQEWVVLDTCFDPNNFNTPIRSLPLHKNNAKYNPIANSIWFSTDQKYSYCQNNWADRVDEANTRRFGS